jgi:hypothetical protein
MLNLLFPPKNGVVATTNKLAYQTLGTPAVPHSMLSAPAKVIVGPSPNKYLIKCKRKGKVTPESRIFPMTLGNGLIPAGMVAFA